MLKKNVLKIWEKLFGNWKNMQNETTARNHKDGVWSVYYWAFEQFSKTIRYTKLSTLGKINNKEIKRERDDKAFHLS